MTCEPYEFTAYGETLDLVELQEAWASALEGVFPYRKMCIRDRYQRLRLFRL